MGTYDNFDELYDDEETTGETEPLGDALPKEDSLEEAYDPDNLPDDRKSNNNRTFMIVLGVLAALFVIIIIVMIVLAGRNIPLRQQRLTETAAAIIAFNEQTIVAATQSAEEAAANAELTQIAAEATVTPYPTEDKEPKATEEGPTPTVIVILPEDDVTPTTDPAESLAATATIEALLTQVAAEATETPVEAALALNDAQMTATEQAAIAAAGDELPDTGILDDGNIYWMGGGALLLIAVIIVTRKMRKEV